MSSSFLKPSVTPTMAFAIRLRARPWNFPSSGSSVAGFATRCPSVKAKLMPEGWAWSSFPFGPCTSTAPSSTFTVTPFGIVIGFLPILDIVHSCNGAPPPTRPLPHVAQHLAAHTGLHGRPPRHHSPGRREDAGAQAGKDFRNLVAPEVHAASGTADPLDAGDEPLAVRSVFQSQPQHLSRRRALSRARLVDHLEAVDIAFVLQDARDLHFDPRRRDVDTGVLGRDAVSNPREHVRNRICHR